MSITCQTTMKPWMVHPPTAGGMHALESKGHTPLICGLRKPLLLLVGQLSVWSTRVDLYIFGNSRTWKRGFWLKWLGRTIILMWKRRTKNRNCLRYHLNCMWRSCWLAPVSCVGLFSSTYPIVFVFFCNFLLNICIIGLQLVFSI